MHVFFGEKFEYTAIRTPSNALVLVICPLLHYFSAVIVGAYIPHVEHCATAININRDLQRASKLRVYSV
jgi:hypothetical protein